MILGLGGGSINKIYQKYKNVSFNEYERSKNLNDINFVEKIYNF